MEHSHTDHQDPEPHSHLAHTKLHTNAGIHASDLHRLTKKAGMSLKEVFDETSGQEKVVLIACTISFILSFMPWASSKSIHITGLSHFVYLIGLLMIATSLYGIIATLGNLYGKKWFSFFGSLSKLHIAVGAEMVILSLIAFTMFSGFISLSTLITEVDTNVTLLILSGLAVLGAGIYENAYEESKKNKKMVLEHLRNEETEKEHELHSILKKHHD